MSSSPASDGSETTVSVVAFSTLSRLNVCRSRRRVTLFTISGGTGRIFRVGAAVFATFVESSLFLTQASKRRGSARLHEHVFKHLANWFAHLAVRFPIQKGTSSRTNGRHVGAHTLVRVWPDWNVGCSRPRILRMTGAALSAPWRLQSVTGLYSCAQVGRRLPARRAPQAGAGSIPLP